MQAIGSYTGRRLLFLGLERARIGVHVDGIAQPLELGHLLSGKDFRGLRRNTRAEKIGLQKWRRDVIDVIARLIAALQPDEVVLGGGNVQKLKTLPHVAG